MAKVAKKGKKKSKTMQQEKKATFAISDQLQDALFIGLMIIILVILLKPLVIDGLSPQGVDVLGSIGHNHQIREYSEETGERALWNPAIFAGMPKYHRSKPAAFSVDTILDFIGRLTHNVFIYYLFGAVGFYFLLRYLKMRPLICFIIAMLFILMPHYKSLYTEGHFTKFRALMILPWILLSFKYFLERRNLLGAALFALAFGLQIRTQHYQIVFYSGLMILAAGIYPFIKDLLEKEYIRFTKSTAMLFVALALALAMAAQPLFLAKEYLPWSKRGKTTIDVSQVNAERAAEKKSDGVSVEYATRWSTYPSEILTWFVPRFYGGMSGEVYRGDDQRLRGHTISSYWGHMPFTQSYEYMGAICLLLAAIGLYNFRRNRLILSLSIFALFLILLSFGRHFLPFYSLFYDYIPFFNKFRAPMMSVTVTYFVFVLFAAYGLKYLADIDRKAFDIKKYQPLMIIIGSFFVLGILIWLYGQTVSFVKPANEPYQGQVLDIIKEVRANFFNQDTLRYLFLVLLAGGSIIIFLMKKINFTALAMIIGVIAIADLIQVQSWVHKEYIDRDKLERRYARKTSTDQFLLNDPETFRIFPAGRLFTDNRWGYYHQTIGGYTPIKMYAIEELVEKNIYNGWDPQFPVNWNVLKILNVKYVVLQQPVQHELLRPVHHDEANKMYTYLFTEQLPRSFFVAHYEVIEDEFERLKRINSQDFDPAETAIVERELQHEVSAPDSSWNRLISFSPNEIIFNSYTDKQALLIISEVYYPPGWKIYIDDQMAENIYKTDHAVQSVVVPAGQHQIEMRFEPDSYYQNITVAYVSLGILYAVILASLFSYFMRRKKANG